MPHGLFVKDRAIRRRKRVGRLGQGLLRHVRKNRDRVVSATRELGDPGQFGTNLTLSTSVKNDLKECSKLLLFAVGEVTQKAVTHHFDMSGRRRLDLFETKIRKPAKGDTTVAGIRNAFDEAMFDHPIDAAREPARRERKLAREVAHAKTPVFGLGQHDEDPVLADGQFLLVLQVEFEICVDRCVQLYEAPPS